MGATSTTGPRQRNRGERRRRKRVEIVIEDELTPGVDPEAALLACGQAFAEALAEVRAEGVTR